MFKIHKNTIVKCTLYFCFLFSFIGIFHPLQVKAASATIGFTAQNPTVTTGEVINVYLTIDADATIGDFEGYISYDPEILEYKTGASCIAGGDGTLKVSDIYASATEDTRKYILKFLALKPGTCEIMITGQPQVFEYETALAMSSSITPIIITVDATLEASTNAQLASLKISPGVLSPEFSTEVYEYSTTVDSPTDSILVSAIAEDTIAKVTISGNKPLYDGDNVVHIFVTAESGKIQEYLIYVHKDAAADAALTPSADLSVTPEPSPEADVEEIGFEWKLEAFEQDGSLYLQGAYQYQISDDEAGVIIPDGFQKTKLMISGIQITAYAPESDALSDFVLLILKNKNGEAAIYRYDRAEKTIQIFNINDIVIVKEDSDTSDIVGEALAKRYKQNVARMGLVIAGLAAVSVVLLIGLVHFYMKAKGLKDDDLD